MIGFCGGHVTEERLTSGESGATVKSKDGLVEDIFTERTTSGDGGRSSGGWLDTNQNNVLLPD